MTKYNGVQTRLRNVTPAIWRANLELNKQVVLEKNSEKNTFPPPSFSQTAANFKLHNKRPESEQAQKHVLKKYMKGMYIRTLDSGFTKKKPG